MISPHFELTGHEAKGLLYGLLEVNKQQLRENPGMPSIRELIRQGKVVYEESDPGEHWQTYREMVEAVNKNGVAYADCEDLAPAVAAEDQVRHGVESLPYAYAPRQGLYHVVTAIPKTAPATFGGRGWPGAMGAPSVPGYGFIDPSAAAGMGSNHLGVRGKFGSLRSPGSSRFGAVGGGPKPGLGLFSAFLEGIGLPTGGSGEDLARQAGRLVGKGAGQVAGGYLENLDLGPLSGVLGGGSAAAGRTEGRTGGGGKGKAAESRGAEEEFGATERRILFGSTERRIFPVYGGILDDDLLEEVIEGRRFGSVSP